MVQQRYKHLIYFKRLAVDESTQQQEVISIKKLKWAQPYFFYNVLLVLLLK